MPQKFEQLFKEYDCNICQSPQPEMVLELREKIVKIIRDNAIGKFVAFIRMTIPPNPHPIGHDKIDCFVYDLWNLMKDVKHECEWLPTSSGLFCRLCGKEMGDEI